MLLRTNETIENKTLNNFLTSHQYLIHDLQIDPTGTILVSSSSDNCLKFYSNKDSTWKETFTLELEENTNIWKLAWSPSTFGYVIAGVTFQNEVVIISQAFKNGKLQWKQQTTVCSLPDSIQKISFSPDELGLVLGVADSSGILHIYHAEDPSQPNIWKKHSEIIVANTCLRAFDWGLQPNYPVMIITAAINRSVKIWKFCEEGLKWESIFNLGIELEVYDIVWSNFVGRDFHLIAISTEEALEIWKIEKLKNNAYQNIEKERIAYFTQINDSIWKLGWNETGNVLASTSNKGIVKLWKSNLLGNWSCISTITGNEDEDNDDDEDEDELEFEIEN
ncbi:nucleoporin seh1 [Anaeramoeba flamelloides]|uniref:Nucleoporin seh1 n=1 Tax=Anaeramoeba flamelloides TaxID=1746091 RepID=A0ABQ8Z780_9EUKA|nr:nucleoporin seh1 [Anaeramoeba flamelloides]